MACVSRLEWHDGMEQPLGARRVQRLLSDVSFLGSWGMCPISQPIRRRWCISRRQGGSASCWTSTRSVCRGTQPMLMDLVREGSHVVCSDAMMR